MGTIWAHTIIFSITPYVSTRNLVPGGGLGLLDPQWNQQVIENTQDQIYQMDSKDMPWAQFGHTRSNLWEAVPRFSPHSLKASPSIAWPSAFPSCRRVSQGVQVHHHSNACWTGSSFFVASFASIRFIAERKLYIQLGGIR